ncbi:MAG: efflux RND transporter permease subunit [Elusimicrobia bacterium]|nr:efflux RND transporter permease subunit [Elusimicrobiota bacterium]
MPGGLNLTRFAVRRPIAISMMFAGACLLGVGGFFRLPVDLMPNTSSGTLTIIIGVRGGMPPEDIENLITKPVEEAISASAGLRHVLSVSRKERSTVTLSYDPRTDMRFAALDIQERLAKIKNVLPKDIEKPVVARYEEAEAPIMISALTAEHHTPEMLRDMVEYQLKPLLTRIDGVANVEIGGGRERKILVEFDHGKLQAFGLPIRHVISLIGLNNLNLLTGKVERQRDAYLVRTLGTFQTVDELKEFGVAVTKEGSRIRLKDIAEVRDFYLEAQSYARLNNRPSVSVYIQKESQTNTVKVAERIQQVVAHFARGLDPDIKIETVANQATHIKEAMGTVREALMLGALLASGLLWFFFRSWKYTTMIVVSIPVSILITFAGMHASSIGLNVMTLSGLTLAIGLIVDDAIVVITILQAALERQMKQLRLQGRSVTSLTQDEVERMVVDATGKVSLAIVASTLTTVIVFLPILFITPEIRMLYSGLALTVTYALMASLLVAITLVPLLASRMLPALVGQSAGAPHPTRWVDDPRWAALATRMAPVQRFLQRSAKLTRRGSLAAWHWTAPRLVHLWQVLKNPAEAPPFAVAGRMPAERSERSQATGWQRFRHVAAWCARRRYRMVGIVLTLFICSALIYRSRLEKEFSVSSEQNEFIIFVELPSGTKLDISNQVVADVERMLNNSTALKPMIKSVASRVEGWSSKVYVTLNPRTQRAASTKEVIRQLRPQVADIGAQYDAFIHFSEPQSANEFIIELYGHDYTVLRQLASAFAQRLESIKGFTDVKLRYKPGRPEVQVLVDKPRAAAFGLTTRDVAESLHAEMRGLRATYFHTANAQVETVARLQEKDRKTVEDVHLLTLATPDELHVPLNQMANFEFALTASEVWRKDKVRVIQVSANRTGLALSTAVNQVMARARDITIPPGYFYQIGGDYVQMQENERAFRLALLLMLLLIYMLLACLFESYAQPLIIMLSVPMASFGAIITLWLTGTAVTIAVYIGFIMLGGLVVKNAIILIDRINDVKAERSLLRAILAVSQERFRPILMTTLSTLLGLLPMVFQRGESGSLWSPLALTVIGGLTFSTFLTLFIVPGSYLILEDVKRWWASGRGVVSKEGAGETAAAILDSSG